MAQKGQLRHAKRNSPTPFAARLSEKPLTANPETEAAAQLV
jgi:hypothetical protein